MALELHHHTCPKCARLYDCVDPECLYRNGKDECCPRCWYGADQVIGVTIYVKRYKELSAVGQG